MSIPDADEVPAGYTFVSPPHKPLSEYSSEELDSLQLELNRERIYVGRFTKIAEPSSGPWWRVTVASRGPGAWRSATEIPSGSVVLLTREIPGRSIRAWLEHMEEEGIDPDEHYFLCDHRGHLLWTGDQSEFEIATETEDLYVSPEDPERFTLTLQGRALGMAVAAQDEADDLSSIIDSDSTGPGARTEAAVRLATMLNDDWERQLEEGVPAADLVSLRNDYLKVDKLAQKGLRVQAAMYEGASFTGQFVGGVEATARRAIMLKDDYDRQLEEGVPAADLVSLKKDYLEADLLAQAGTRRLEAAGWSPAQPSLGSIVKKALATLANRR